MTRKGKRSEMRRKELKMKKEGRFPPKRSSGKASRTYINTKVNND
jgi:hypothetical protein